MQPFYRAGLTIWRLDLDGPPPESREQALLAAPETHEWRPEAPGLRREAVSRVPAPAVRRGELGQTRVTSQAFAAPCTVRSGKPVSREVAVMGHPLPIPPLPRPTGRDEPVALNTTVHELPALPMPGVHADLAFMRSRFMQRRAIPARFMSDAQIAYWQQRMSNAKRVTPKLIQIVGLFPDVPIVGDQPVQYLAKEGAIAFPVPPEPVPLTTVVIARHERTGQLMIGRFAT
ncbi:MAG TPA: hypothetical protein V6D47_09935 [Oscillatoriaceae cyanobacterium]